MWVATKALHTESLVSLIQQGVTDCLLVSSQCGGQVSTNSLLLALHSPLLAELLGQVGEGVLGITLPLPLHTLRGLVALLQGEDGEVLQEVKEAAAALGIVGQEEIKQISRYTTLEEELTSDFKFKPENIITSMDTIASVNKSLDISEQREHQVFYKEGIKSFSDDDAFLLNEDSWPAKKTNQTNVSEENNEKIEEVFLHEPKHSRVQVLCELCSKTFTNKSYIKQHMIAVHEKHEKSAPCSYCSKKVSILSISNHEKICKMTQKEREEYYKNRDKQLQCIDCDKTFANLSKLNRHMESVHKREINKCQHCGIQEKGIVDLKLHIKQNHEEVKIKPKVKRTRTVCTVCCKSFNGKQYLGMHMLVAHGNKGSKFVRCPVCGKEYSLLNIVNHNRLCKMSNDERERYKEMQKAFCQDCGKTFSRRLRLKKHLQSAKHHQKTFEVHAL